MQQKWCLGNHPLPFERHQLDLVDPSQNPPECREQDIWFLLLSLKTTAGKAEWLEECLGVHKLWWRRQGHRQPLMQELANSYPKRAKGILSRDTVITISRRGKEIMVLNLRAPPTLAFYESKGDFESLIWFLGELKGDMGGADQAPRAPRTSVMDVDEQGDLEHVLEDLKSHPNCRYAWYLPSIKAIEVHHSISKRSTKLRLKALKKRGGLTLEDAAAKGLAFLQEVEAPAASSSCALEPRDMSVHGAQQEREDLEFEKEEEEG